AVDRRKCALWNVSVADVQNALQTAVGGKPCTQVIEGEKSFDLTLRWPERLRADEDLILDIPVDVIGHAVTSGTVPSAPQTPVSGPSTGVSPTGTSAAMPSLSGSLQNPVLNATTPRRRLRDLLTPPESPGQPDRAADFTRP